MLKQVIVQPDITDKINAERMRMMITTLKRINLDRTVTVENCINTSYDKDEWEKIPESHLLNNSETSKVLFKSHC